MEDVITTIRRIRELAGRADLLARAVEAHRVRVALGGGGGAASIELPHRTNIKHAANGASVMAIAHMAQICRDLHSTYATAFAALPQELQKQIAAN